MRTVPVVVLAVLAVGCTSGGSTPGAIRASAPASPTVASSPSAEPSPEASPTQVATSARAVYYLHDDGQSLRLYREFHSRPATTGVIRDAVTTMLSEQAYDGDYTSVWPKATWVLGVRLQQTVEGTVAYVDLSREALTGSAGGEGEAQSLQQLVWTVTAAAPAARSVQLLVEGKAPPSLWGHVSTRRPIARSTKPDVLGAVWLTAPRSLAHGGPFGGEATVFEATVSWEFRQGGRLVKRGHTNASTGAPGRGTWSAVADVPAGDYVLRAYESSAKDGRPLHVDDKPVTVTG